MQNHTEMALGLCHSKALSCDDAAYISLFALKDYNAQGDVELGSGYLNERRFPLDHHPEGDDKFPFCECIMASVSVING